MKKKHGNLFTQEDVKEMGRELLQLKSSVEEIEKQIGFRVWYYDGGFTRVGLTVPVVEQVNMLYNYLGLTIKTHQPSNKVVKNKTKKVATK